MRYFGLALAYAAILLAHTTRAETVSYASIGCDDLTATLMAEEALRDKMSGKDHKAMDRITAYRDKMGQRACQPLNQGQQVTIIKEQDDMVCVRAQDEKMIQPDDPVCYWIRHRHIKLPNP